MSDSPDNPTFEQSLAELERIVHDLEDGQTGLEESLARRELWKAKEVELLHGSLLIAQCRLLQGIDSAAEEQRLRVLLE